jgi:hypothetical protein
VMSLGAGSGPITNYTVISALVVEGVSLGWLNLIIAFVSFLYFFFIFIYYFVQFPVEPIDCKLSFFRVLLYF